MYKLIANFIGVEPMAVFKIDTEISIPFDAANKDYQRYLVWLAAGNEPLPADDVAPNL